MKNFKPSLFSILLSLFLSLSISPALQASEKQSAVVREVLAGDTIRLEGGKTLKYTGLSSPPLQSKIPLVRQYGANALEFNKNLVDGKKILIEWGSQIRDARGNLMGYVFLENGTFVNQEILKAGHARAAIKPPNIKYAGEFHELELQAHRNKRGLWEKEPENPFLKSEYIGEKNTRVYYFPDSSELEHFPQGNLVKFRSRVEAKAAGYRPCKTCYESAQSEY